MKKLNLPNKPEAPTRVVSSDLVGQRVEITNGAWKGETGTVRSIIPENGCLRVRLDSGIQLPWDVSELRKLPNEKGQL